MAFLQRYSTLQKGGITMIGNTLGLSKLSNVNQAGLLGSIGAFTSLDNTLKVNNFPNGTTLDYTQNGSTANLNLPVGSNVLYAELVWGGLYKSSVNDISSLIDNNIIFNTPQGTFSITNDIATRQNFNINLTNNEVGFYVRTAIVTNLVQNGMNGVYSVQSVPALIEAIDNRTNETNHAGWSLVIVYSNPSLDFKSLNVWTGGAVVSPLVGVTNITLNGFKTPSEVQPSGRIFVSAQEGDAVISGDQMLFGQDVLTLTNLSGPNNPVLNFFCSQINGENGLVDTSGTFGTRNANSLTGSNTLACRQGYDITSIDLTGKLSSGQSDAYIRFTTAGDLYVPNCIAIEIDNGTNPDLNIIKTVDKTIAVSGEILNYTSTITNTGDLPLYNLLFSDQIPAGSTFIENSVFINGVNFPGYNPQIPFPINDLLQTQSAVVTFQVKIDL